MKLSQMRIYVRGQLINDNEFEMLEQCTAECGGPFLTFMENPKFLERINPNATCVLCRPDMTEAVAKRHPGIGIMAVAEPRRCFFEIHNALYDKSRFSFTTRIGRNCQISPHAVIAEKGVVIGDNAVVEDFVQINKGAVIGNNCIIHSHVVIAGKSYTFVQSSDGELIGVNDGGSVEIGNNVEIFPFVNIAVGVLEADITKIGDGTKIDALVHIGHGARIGKNCKIVAGTQVGGNAVLGDNCSLGINSTISNRLYLGDNSKVSLGAVVTKNLEENSKVSGNFAIDHDVFMHNLKKSVEQ